MPYTARPRRSTIRKAIDYESDTWPMLFTGIIKNTLVNGKEVIKLYSVGINDFNTIITYSLLQNVGCKYYVNVHCFPVRHLI